MRPWVIDGAAVRVSLVCFSRAEDEFVTDSLLDGEEVDEIHTDLTGRRDGVGVDLTKARRLDENAGVAFMGDTKGGPFGITGDQAQEWLRLPANPNERTNADVLKPWVNGMDLTQRPAGKWIVDFGLSMSDRDAALYEGTVSVDQGARLPGMGEATRGRETRPVVVASSAAACNARSAQRFCTIHCDASRSQTPPVSLARCSRLS